MCLFALAQSISAARQRQEALSDCAQAWDVNPEGLTLPPHKGNQYMALRGGSLVFVLPEQSRRP